MEPILKDTRYTVRDYLNWDDSERWELIDGVAYALAAPTLAHQTLVGEIHAELRNYLKGKTCRVFMSPVDVVFSEDEDDDTIVQPDIAVVCDPSKISGGKRIIGAPDIVVEVLSPSSAFIDLDRKLQLYQRQGVGEYWIVSPEDKAISQRILKDGAYEAKTHDQGVLQAAKLDGFTLDIAELFSALGNGEAPGSD